MAKKEIPAFIRCYLNETDKEGRNKLMALAKEFHSAIQEKEKISSAKERDARLQEAEDRFSNEAYRIAWNHGFDGGPYDPVAEAQAEETAKTTRVLNALEFAELFIKKPKKDQDKGNDCSL